MTYTEVGTENLRATFYDGVVKGFAEAAYKFKQALNISSTGAWTNYFFREQPDALTGTTTTGITTNNIVGIPRGSDFPQASKTWERISSVIKKYGLEQNIPWEDILTDEINVKERTLFRIAEGVAKSVDDEVFDVLTENRTTTLGQIQSFLISDGAVNPRSWDVSSAAIIDDLLRAKQLIAEKNYDTSNLMAFVSPKDYRSIMNYIAEKGAQFPAMGTEVATNGRMGKLAGVQLVVSNSVTASFALVVVPKICGNWKELVPLSTDTKEDKFKSFTIRAAELGVTQVTDPKAIVLIKGTQDD